MTTKSLRLARLQADPAHPRHGTYTWLRGWVPVRPVPPGG